MILNVINEINEDINTFIFWGCHIDILSSIQKFTEISLQRQNIIITLSPDPNERIKLSFHNDNWYYLRAINCTYYHSQVHDNKPKLICRFEL